MSNLLPDKWNEVLERVHDKGGHFLSKPNAWKKDEHTSERITADTLPAFMKFRFIELALGQRDSG